MRRYIRTDGYEPVNARAQELDFAEGRNVAGGITSEKYKQSRYLTNVKKRKGYDDAYKARYRAGMKKKVENKRVGQVGISMTANKNRSKMQEHNRKMHKRAMAAKRGRANVQVKTQGLFKRAMGALKAKRRMR